MSKTKTVEFSRLLKNSRLKKSSIERREPIDDFYSDHSRIIYSSSFRRLQQKAQVFSLEPNASVHTRMTHTLEVADIGRTLSNKISLGLLKKKLISEKDMPILAAIVENACLLHDIGNPPFGHFGEAAIKEWAKSELDKIATKAGILCTKTKTYKLLTSDFLEFDGNPQGFRVITKLHTERDEFGLNLSYATLLSAIKYARSTGELKQNKREGIYKKAGYFQSEKYLVEKICTDMNRKRLTRFPLAYIMEAADDIAYCLSDILDGIEKRIITLDKFLESFKSGWDNEFAGAQCPVEIPEKAKNFSLDIAVPWSRMAMEEAAKNFVDQYDLFLEGKKTQLVPEKGMGRVFKIIKQVSRNIIYSSIEAESIELTGHAVITGILESYQLLLMLPYEQFSSINQPEMRDFEYERRLYNRIGERYLHAYTHMCDDYRNDTEFNLREWWARVHLVIDHISGMTDEFALNTYQMLKGINLLPL